MKQRLSKKQRSEIAALAKFPDGRIDTSDIPEMSDWSGAKRGRFYRPVKKQLTLRVDADVIAWFKGRTTGGRGYQTGINRALREYVEKQSRPRKSAKR